MSLARWLLCCAVCVSPAGMPASAPDAAPPQLTRLVLDVRIDYERERIAGTATLALRNVSTRPMAHVPLLLNRLLAVTSIVDGDGAAVRYEQRVATFGDVAKLQVDAVEAALPRPVPPGESVTLAVAYAGHLTGYTEVGWLYVRDHVAREFTILRADAYAFPVVGTTSQAANDAVPRAPFDFAVAITVPADLVAVAGGRETGRSRDGADTTYRYRSTRPAPFVYVAIAPYRVIEDGALRVFHFAEDEAGARALLSAVKRAAARLTAIFGPLDGPLELTIMEIPDGWGSQASLAAGILQEAVAFRGNDKLQPLYHELSHLWNATDLEPASPRWNEGLATFLQGRLAATLDGWQGAAERWRRIAQRLLERCSANEPCGRVPMIDYGRERLTDLSYTVGELMFAALYRAIGEPAFDRALRRHYQRHRATGTRTQDLVDAFRKEGGRAAQRVFDTWLYSTAWRRELHAARSSPAVDAAR